MVPDRMQSLGQLRRQITVMDAAGRGAGRAGTEQGPRRSAFVIDEDIKTCKPEPKGRF